MQTRSQAQPITTEERVRRLNAIARQMDELCKGVHPSALHELTAEMQGEFHRVAQMPTDDSPEQPSL